MPGRGSVMLAFHMLCHADQHEAEQIAGAHWSDTCNRWSPPPRPGHPAQLRRLQGYDQVIAALARETFETQVEKCAAWIGTPEQILDTIATYQRQVGGFEIASLQVNFNDIKLEQAEASMRLFGERVLPKLASA